jgi:glycosyltransferase involved in cell wall biosynthesis
MKVGVLVHFYVPYRCAGSETMLHAMLKALQVRGHEVRVFTTQMAEAPTNYEYEGIPVGITNPIYAQQLLAEWNPDVIVSHHQNTRYAARMKRLHGIPFVFLMHNDMPGTPEVLETHPDLVVFNTEWLAKKFRDRVANSVVVHPPVYAEDHATTRGSKITLVNLNQDKGGGIFYALAERMPDLQFLGVVGGHGSQVIRRDLPNVTIQEHSDDMRNNVWSKTRLLLMPSIYESYGMAGVEALASGIPVIANPTAGLRESLGCAGLFLDRDDLAGWEKTIRRALSPEVYPELSRTASLRSAELDPRAEMAAWADAVERIIR